MEMSRNPKHSLTFDDAIEVWLCHWQGQYQHVIAAHFQTNQGRINEILKGKRFPESRDAALKLRAAA